MSDVFSTIQCLFEEDKRNQFPYADCRKIEVRAGGKARDLIPDLAAYFADIAGYCSRGSHIVGMSSEEFLKMKKVAGTSFFEKHPEYEPIKTFITETDTHELLKNMGRSEQMRIALLRIADLHVADQSLY
jgi:hypothetical protein